jgi:membrane-bound metal-dependent hydrolase YbcI (DUF457 family)
VLAAHLVPGYFIAIKSQAYWQPAWNKRQRIALWVAALGSTVVPDLDVIYNALFRGFINHSTLWTHSIFIHLSIGLCWLLLRRMGRWPYVQMLVGIVALGGLSHLILDVVSHGTPLFYPFSLFMVGAPSRRVLQGGAPGYLTDPILLVEVYLLALAAAHWLGRRKLAPRIRRLALVGLLAGVILFTCAFLLLLPTLQSLIVI